MRKTLLTLALAATAMTSAASAQGDPATGGPAMRADADRTRFSTRAEAIAAADARFAQIDTDHDGTASPTEMRAYRAAMRDRMIARGGEVADPPSTAGGHGGRQGGRQGDRQGGRGHRMGGAGAERGDGSVTRQEFEDRAARRFDRMDADHPRDIQPGNATPVMPAPTPVS